MATSFILLLSVSALPLCFSTECVTSQDCPSSAPFCSKWGYCQWTQRYGDQGPGQTDCTTDADCGSERFPVCSPQGYCTNSRNDPSRPLMARPAESDGRKSEDNYYDYYDYNYYAGFEVLRSQKQSDKSTRDKIQEQFLGTTSRPPSSSSSSPSKVPSSSRRTRPSQPKSLQSPDPDEWNSSSRGCLTDCVTDCIAIAELSAYKDCVGFCGKTCTD